MYVTELSSDIRKLVESGLDICPKAAEQFERGELSDAIDTLRGSSSDVGRRAGAALNLILPG